MEHGVAVSVLGVNVGARVNQDLHDIRMLPPDGLMEHWVAASVLRVNVGARIGQDLHNLLVVSPDRLVYEGIVVRSPHIDVRAPGNEFSYPFGLAPPDG